jgi:hypothetical protein
MRLLRPILLTSLLLGAPAWPADRPHNALFEQLVGTWDVRYEFTDKNGKARTERGTAHYSWILDGQALQEIWTSNSGGAQQKPFGTTIDFYDSKRGQWTAVWVYPSEGMTQIMTGDEVNGELVLTGHDESGALQRWSTRVLERDCVVTRLDISKDEGKTWQEGGVSYLQRVAKRD